VFQLGSWNAQVDGNGMAARKQSALIIEDQPFVGLVTSDILNEEGLETQHAHDAAGALEILRSNPQITVVVLDADLQGSTDGLDLGEQISREWPHVRIVLTTSGFAAGLPRALERAAVIRVPFASSELRACISGQPLLQQV
jgi:CheY-like chemotaxis protein